jgi:hypothetical protein
MKSTFHEVKLGQAVIQNATETGTEQLIVTLPSEGDTSSIEFQIKENKDGTSSSSHAMSIDQHGLQMLFRWLREEGVM